MDLSETVVYVIVSPSSTASNLGVILNDRLSCTPNIPAVAQSCKFALCNIRKIRSFLITDAMHLLVEVLVISRQDYRNLLLSGLPAFATKLYLECCSVPCFLSTQILHLTMLLRYLHWLPVAAHN